MSTYAWSGLSMPDELCHMLLLKQPLLLLLLLLFVCIATGAAAGIGAGAAGAAAGMAPSRRNQQRWLLLYAQPFSVWRVYSTAHGCPRHSSKVHVHLSMF